MRLIEQTTDQRQSHRVRMTELFLLAQFARKKERLRLTTCHTREIVRAYVRTGDAYLTHDAAYNHLLSTADTDGRPMFDRERANEYPLSLGTIGFLAEWLCSDRLTVQLPPTTEDNGTMDIRLGQGCLLASDDDSENQWTVRKMLDDMPEEQAIEINALKLVMWIYDSYPTEIIENPIKTFNDEFEASIGNEGLDPESRLGRMSQEEFLAERTAAEVAGTLTSKFRKTKSRMTVDVARDILQEFGDTFRLSGIAMQHLGIMCEGEDPSTMTWIRSSAIESLRIDL